MELDSTEADKRSQHEFQSSDVYICAANYYVQWERLSDQYGAMIG